MVKNVFCSAILLICGFILPAHILYGQSYTTLDDDGTQREFTSITSEQFNRLRATNEQSALSVLVQFYDVVQAINSKVIKGSRPNFSGESYWIIKETPVNSYEMIWVRYRNGNKCFMNICFYNIDLSVISGQFISLSYNRAEYIRRHNLYTDMVKNAK
ncbi:MAG: hypothetical protein LBG80_11725 [Bacteroidales bacterium]|jgi:hypothetical protein|nr:hypothetical protein [Bacteroidales bacterium]